MVRIPSYKKIIIIPGVVLRVAAITPFHFFSSLTSTKDLALDAIPEARASMFSAGLSPSKMLLEGPVTVATLVFPDEGGWTKVPSKTDHSTLILFSAC